MTNITTPGEVAYNAWQAAMLERWPQLALATWELMPFEEQAPWEAAAEAAIAQWWRAHETIICGEEEEERR